MKKFTVELIFPLIVLVLSLLKMLDLFSSINIPALLISLVGITSALLYFKKIRHYKYFMYLWILAQIIVIQRDVFDPNTLTWRESPIWDTTQVVKFIFSLNLNFKASKVVVGINVLAFSFFGFLKIVEVSFLIGKKFIFEKFGPNNKLGNIFPLSGTAIRRVKVSGKKDYLLIQLDFPFVFHDKEVSYVLIKDKNAGLIEPGKKQLVYFKIVKDLNDVTEGDNDGKKFPFIDWAYCQ